VEVELLHEVPHEVLARRVLTEVAVLAVVDREHFVLSLDLVDEIVGDGSLAGRVGTANDERHGNGVHPANVDLGALIRACVPLLAWDRLLVAVGKAELGPQLLRLDRDWLRARVAAINVADERAKVVADCLKVFGPVRPVDRVNAIVLKLHQRAVNYARKHAGQFGVEAGRQMNDSVQVSRVEVILIVRQGVVHLGVALRIPDVLDFVRVSASFDV